VKAVLVLLAVLVGVWLWRQGRLKARAAQTPAPTPAPLAMVRCTHCGLHLPQSEVLLDTQGQPYCSAAHRSAGAPAP